MSAFQLQNVRYRHEAIADLMIENPNLDQNDIAARLGFTASWLSAVVNSDGFKEYFACRRQDHERALSTHVVERDDESLHDQIEGVASKSLEAIQSKLETNGANLKLDELANVASKTLSALGFGSTPGGDRRSGNTQINLYTGAVTPEDLAAARAKMPTSASPEPKVIEHEPKEVVPAST